MHYTTLALAILPSLLLAQDINVSSILNNAQSAASSLGVEGQSIAATDLASAGSLFASATSAYGTAVPTIVSDALATASAVASSAVSRASSAAGNTAATSVVAATTTGSAAASAATATAKPSGAASALEVVDSRVVMGWGAVVGLVGAVGVI